AHGIRSLREFHQLKSLELPKCSISSEAVLECAELKQLEHLALSENDLGDSDICQVHPLRLLKYISLDGTRITDDCFKKFHSWFPMLRTVLANDTLLTDACVETLIRVTGLTVLGFGNTSITDTGIQLIAKMPKLEILDVSNTAVTHLCIPYLERIPNLWRIIAEDTELIDRDFAQLKAKNPNLKVHLS
ncbi:MAG: hypothetical protein N2C14_20645, partial [Planctomycetales bacterium]